MKKRLLLLIIPFFIYSQNDIKSQNDTEKHFFTFNGTIDQPLGFGVSTFYTDSGHGFFMNLKFEIGEVLGKKGRDYTNDLGSMINYFTHNENSNYNYAGLYNGRSSSFLIGFHIPLISNLYLSPGIGFLAFPERAQYNSEDLGGDFYYRTKLNGDFVGTLGLSTIIMDKLYFQFGVDILPEKEKSDYIYNNTFERLKKNTLFSYNFSIGFIPGRSNNK